MLAVKSYFIKKHCEQRKEDMQNSIKPKAEEMSEKY